ncbi:MAG: hypothetical protein AB7N76_01535 [Planctomycetota bacterium]
MAGCQRSLVLAGIVGIACWAASRGAGEPAPPGPAVAATPVMPELLGTHRVWAGTRTFRHVLRFEDPVEPQWCYLTVGEQEGKAEASAWRPDVEAGTFRCESLTWDSFGRVELQLSAWFNHEVKRYRLRGRLLPVPGGAGRPAPTSFAGEGTLETLARDDRGVPTPSGTPTINLRWGMEPFDRDPQRVLHDEQRAMREAAGRPRGPEFPDFPELEGQ